MKPKIDIIIPPDASEDVKKALPALRTHFESLTDEERALMAEPSDEDVLGKLRAHIERLEAEEKAKEAS